MTEEEMFQIVERDGVMVKVDDIQPYQYYLPCIVDGRAILNDIVYRSKHSDGERIMFGLDTHNTWSAEPGHELMLVPVRAREKARKA